jgi:hypothetical protein
MRAFQILQMAQVLAPGLCLEADAHLGIPAHPLQIPIRITAHSAVLGEASCLAGELLLLAALHLDPRRFGDQPGMTKAPRWNFSPKN